MGHRDGREFNDTFAHMKFEHKANSTGHRKIQAQMAYLLHVTSLQILLWMKL